MAYQSKWRSLIALAVGVWALMAWSTPSVELVSAGLHDPWDGLVDLELKIEGVEHPGDYYVEILAEMVNPRIREFYYAKSLTGAAPLYEASNGVWKVVWDAGRDGVNLSEKSGSITVRLAAAKDGDRSGCAYADSYMIVNLRSGEISFETYLDHNPARYQDIKFKTGLMVFKRVKAGSFIMGANGEPFLVNPPYEGLAETCHLVTLTHDFYCAIYLMSAHQYDLIMGRDKRLGQIGAVAWRTYDDIRGRQRGLDPQGLADCVVDDDSIMGRMRALTGGRFKFDLLTDAQWEYVCRAGTTGMFYFEIPDELQESWMWNPGNMAQNVVDFLRPLMHVVHEDPLWTHCNYPLPDVGMLRPNPWGFYDMLGLTYEYVRDLTTGDDARSGADWGVDSVEDPLRALGNERSIYRSGNVHVSWVRNRSSSRARVDRERLEKDNEWSWMRSWFGIRVSATLDNTGK